MTTTTGAARVAASNTDQAKAWDGPEGDYWATQADRFERSTSAYDEAILGAAALDEKSRVLDVGCGTGSTTRLAARAASRGSALGVDLSRRMLEVARQRAAAEGLSNVRFEQADAQVHPFGRGAYDVVISRTAAMFFGDPAQAFTNLRAATRDSGRLAVLVWAERARNEWFNLITEALMAGRPFDGPPPGVPGPFALSDSRALQSLLERSGFRDARVTRVQHRMCFGTDATDACDFILGVSGWMLTGLDEQARAAAIDDLRGRLVHFETADGVLLGSSAWLAGARAA